MRNSFIIILTAVTRNLFHMKNPKKKKKKCLSGCINIKTINSGGLVIFCEQKKRRQITMKMMKNAKNTVKQIEVGLDRCLNQYTIKQYKQRAQKKNKR